MPARSQFYGRAEKFALEAFYSQFFARIKFWSRACHVIKTKAIVFRYDHFSANAAFDSHYLIETTAHTELVGCYCIILD